MTSFSVSSVVEELWAVFKDGNIFNSIFFGGISLPKSVSIEAVSYACYSGLEQLRNSSGSIIKLSKVGYLNLSVLIVCDRENCRMDWRFIREKFITSVDLALACVQEQQSPASRLFRCRESYKHFVSYTKCDICRSAQMRISANAFPDWGCRLVETLNKELNFLGYECFIFVNGTVEIVLEKLFGTFQILELHRAICLGLNMRQDFVLEGKAAFWNYHNVVEKSDFGVLSKENYPMLISGHGEFTFTRDQANNVDNQFVCVESIKFGYGHLIDLARKRTLPTTYACDLDVPGIKQKLEKMVVLQRFIHAIATTGQPTPGIQIKMTIQRIEEFSCSTDVLTAFRNQIEQTCGSNLQILLSAFPLNKYIQHVNQTLLPLVRAITKMYWTIIQRRDELSVLLDTIPTIGQIEAIRACEVLLSFWLSGNLDTIHGLQKSPSLEALIKLKQKHFRKSAEPFKDLMEWCPTLHFANDGTVEYNGPYDLSEDVWFSTLGHDASEEDISSFNQSFGILKALKLDCDAKPFMTYYDTIASFMWKLAMRHSSRHIVTSSKLEETSPQQIHQIINDMRLEVLFMNAEEFVSSIFCRQTEMSFQLSISLIAREISSITENIQELKDRILVHFEKNLLSSIATALLYPIRTPSASLSPIATKAILVMPTCKTHGYKYYQLDSAKRAKVMEHYKYSLSVLYPEISGSGLTKKIEKALGSAEKFTVNEMVSNYVTDCRAHSISI